MVGRRDPKSQKFRDGVEETIVEISCQQAELTGEELWNLIIKMGRPGIYQSPYLFGEKLVNVVQGLIEEERVVGRVEIGGLFRASKFFFDTNANIRLISEERTQLLEQSRVIKNTILDLGTKFTRLQVAEITECCHVDDEDLIIETIQDMIAKHQVDAQYFASTKAVAFNQQANLAARDAFIAELESEFASWGKNEQSGKVS